VRLDFTLSLFWLSLAISAAAVVLFVWLMREEREQRKDAPHPTLPAARFARRGLRPRPALSKARGDPSRSPAEGEGETEDGSSRRD